ncbi:MAG: SoxR reducing system RseC family protein [Oscillospiraceae bacterium]|nr:SoxR reducing system RseC family protein [Oscillospiraceae bacterium]
MQRKATVQAILPDGRAELAVQRESACSGDCHQCGGCGTVGQTLRLTAENPIGAQRGDVVYISSESATVLWAAVLVYTLPLLLFLTGYLLSMRLGAWAAAIGTAGFLAGLAPAFAYNRRVKKRPPVYTIIGFVK